MSASLRAELLKLRKRPAVWVLAVIMLASLVLFGYLVTYLFLVAEVGGAVPAGADFLPDLLPDRAVANAVSGLAGFGGTFGLILGALSAGSEYGWRTVKTIVTQRPSRSAVAAGKVGGLAVVSLVLSVAYLVTAFLCSLVVAVAVGEEVVLPDVATILGGLAAAWLVLLVWTSLGLFLAVLFRGTGLAIGLGLVYVLVIEQLAVSLPLPEALSEALRSSLIGPSSLALSSGFGDLASTGMAGGTVLEPGPAAGVLGSYLVGFLAVAWLAFTRREIG